MAEISHENTASKWNEPMWCASVYISMEEANSVETSSCIITTKMCVATGTMSDLTQFATVNKALC